MNLFWLTQLDLTSMPKGEFVGIDVVMSDWLALNLVVLVLEVALVMVGIDVNLVVCVYAFGLCMGCRPYLDGCR